jgi:hypothetical protein
MERCHDGDGETLKTQIQTAADLMSGQPLKKYNYKFSYANN